jgi:hypothetical protein
MQSSRENINATDCSIVIKKLQVMLHSAEQQLTVFLTQLATKTLPN